VHGSVASPDPLFLGSVPRLRPDIWPHQARPAVLRVRGEENRPEITTASWQHESSEGTGFLAGGGGGGLLLDGRWIKHREGGLDRIARLSQDKRGDLPEAFCLLLLRFPDPLGLGVCRR